MSQPDTTNTEIGDGPFTIGAIMATAIPHKLEILFSVLMACSFGLACSPGEASEDITPLNGIGGDGGEFVEERAATCETDCNDHCRRQDCWEDFFGNEYCGPEYVSPPCKAACELERLEDCNKCEVAKANPSFWQARAAIEALRGLGKINSEGDCLNRGDWIAEKAKELYGGVIGYFTAVIIECACLDVDFG